MIYYLTTARHQYTVDTYLASWGKPLASILRPMTYERLFVSPRLPPGAYVFTDVERLSPAARSSLVPVWHAIEQAGWPRLNHPTRTLQRYELLRTLFEAGINEFDTLRLTEARAPRRFPVYVRRFDEHGGTDGQLLPDAEAYARKLETLLGEGADRDRLIVEEFLDTRDARGLYRKFSAFVVGDQVIPRHIFYGKQWIVRQPDVVDDATISEELDYGAQNPHQETIRAVFRLARCEFGRIDYGLRDGRPQVWEINTNPQLLSARDGGGPRRQPVHERAAAGLAAALTALSDAAPRAGRSLPNPAFERVAREAVIFVLRRGLHRGLAWTGQLGRELELQKKLGAVRARWLGQR